LDYSWILGNNTTMFSIVDFINKKNCLLKFFLIGFLFLPNIIFSQTFKLRKSSDYIKSYQIEFITNKNYLFVSDNGWVEIPFNQIGNFSKIKITDFDSDISYDLYPEELKIKEGELQFLSETLIEPVLLTKKAEKLIGIDSKGGLSNLYIRSNSSKIIEIPEIGSQYEGSKIKKIRYYFSGGNNTLYDVKTSKKNINIVPILYTCDSVNCKNKKLLIPEMEVGFTGKSKFLEVDISNYNIFIEENDENLYVGYIALEYFVVKQKKTQKIGNLKCYNNFPEVNEVRESSIRCPVISIIVQ